MTEKSKEELLEELLAGRQITDELHAQILRYAGKASLVVASQNVAAIVDHRSEYGSSGGIGYWSQVRVFCGSQSQMREWQWRDRYSASNDKPWLSVQGFGAISVVEVDGKMNVELELVNKGGNRKTMFIFDPPKPSTVRKLTEEEKVAFKAKVRAEQARIMERLYELHKLKPLAILKTGEYGSYYEPSVKQSVTRADAGVAAFVTEEQIDCHAGDRQMRHELFVCVAGKSHGVVERKAEDHGYEREGGAFLTILEVEFDHIDINTKRGKQTIAIAV